MPKINLLTPDIYGLIAAGEVVESPAGALKELVENSIDAGSRCITIEVRGGGFEYISVTDDGCGIDAEQIERAFMEHATSKVATACDLDAIETLGFRGEALPSIAAVSHVKITSRTRTCDTGVCACVEGGKVVDKKLVSANVGTQIEIRDIFYNTPARKKFFKTPSREATDIAKFVSKLIFANPLLQITYVQDGKTVYRTKGNDMQEALFTVYGADCLSNCIPVNYTRNTFRITGYIGTPEYSKANRLHQYLSVNGRCITDIAISSSIQQAYKQYLMQHQFPFFVLNLEIPCSVIDVNVHPRKNEIRFSDAHMVTGAFYRAVNEALEQYSKSKVEQIFDDKPIKQLSDGTTDVKQISSLSPEECQKRYQELKQSGVIQQMTPNCKEVSKAIEQSSIAYDKQIAYEKMLSVMNDALTVESVRRRAGLPPLKVDKKGKAVASQSFTMPSYMPTLSKPIEISNEAVDYSEGVMSRMKIIGSIFKTYLLLELDDNFIMIDQHAAHERILFDRFMEGRLKNMQTVMIPYVFTVKKEESQFILDNLENILSAGIDIEPFGEDTFRIRAVSTLLLDTQMDKFVNYLLSSVDEFKVNDKTLIVEAIAKKACKAAVKAGYTLNDHEIKYILESVVENKIIQCPHGRPIFVVYSKTQIEKMFKRIV